MTVDDELTMIHVSRAQDCIICVCVCVCEREIKRKREREKEIETNKHIYKTNT